MSRTSVSRLLCGVLVAVGLVAPASAWATTPIFPSATEVTLPTGANTAAGQQIPYLQSVACTSAGNCVAVGEYPDGGLSAQGDFNSLPMVVTESNGVWGQPAKITLPAGAATAAGTQQALLKSVACTSAGNCVAVGTYSDVETVIGAGPVTTTTGSQTMVVTESNGVWGQANKITLPTGATTIGGQAQANTQLDSVACTSAGNCVAVGSYSDSSGYDQAMTVTESNGAWDQASAVTIPGQEYSGLSSVTCTSAGNCQTVGFYGGPTTSSPDLSLVVTESNGVWGTGSALTQLPTGSAAPNHEYAALHSIACTSGGNCQATGTYQDSAGSYQALVFTEANGVWGQASEVDLIPPGAPANLGNAPQTDQLNSITCTSGGDCVAAGSYGYVDSYTVAITITETDGVWGDATKLSLPTGAITATDSQFAALTSVVCLSPGVCTGVGGYIDGSSNEQAMVVTSSPSLTITTTNLPSTKLGSHYSAQLAASGGSGTYTWSITSGSLPAGLNLSASTGAISGVPTSALASTFTVTVTDSESPAQTANATFTIKITPPPAPHVGGVRGGKGGRVAVPLTCPGTSAQICEGTIRLSIVGHLKTGKRRTRIVMLGVKHYDIKGGTHATINVGLNRAGHEIYLFEYGGRQTFSFEYGGRQTFSFEYGGRQTFLFEYGGRFHVDASVIPTGAMSGQTVLFEYGG